MTRPNLAVRLTHVGFYVRSLEPMIAYYERVIGMVVTDKVEGRAAFLSRDPQEHHQIVLVQGRPDGSFALINQISFRLDDLAALRSYHAFLSAEGVEGLEAVTHGNAWSVYFLDPEGNRIELYTGTAWHVGQPLRVAVDMTASEGELVAQNDALVRDNPSRLPQGAWQDSMRNRLA